MEPTPDPRRRASGFTEKLAVRSWPLTAEDSSAVVSNETGAHGEADQPSEIGHAEAFHELIAMRLHRPIAQSEPLGDVLARVSLGHELQDLALPRRQRRERIGDASRAGPATVAARLAPG